MAIQKLVGIWAKCQIMITCHVENIFNFIIELIWVIKFGTNWEFWIQNLGMSCPLWVSVDTNRVELKAIESEQSTSHLLGPSVALLFVYLIGSVLLLIRHKRRHWYVSHYWLLVALWLIFHSFHYTAVQLCRRSILWWNKYDLIWFNYDLWL